MILVLQEQCDSYHAGNETRLLINLLLSSTASIQCSRQEMGLGSMTLQRRLPDPTDDTLVLG